MRTLVGPDSSWQNRYTARAHLRRLYRPYAKFGAVRCPVLVCVCEKDQYTPPAPAIKVAQRAPNAELRRYPIRHFDIYPGRVVRARGSPTKASS